MRKSDFPVNLKMPFPCRLFVIFTLCLGPSLHAADYYVSPDGLDTNPGTDAQPFKTLNKAKNTAVAGDTVFIKDGTYQNSNYGNGKTTANAAALRLTVSGDSTSGHITFKNYPGHNPKIQFDGSAGISFANGVEYIIIEGLEIEGPAAGITYAEAFAKREERAGNGPATGDANNYYNNRGIVGFGPHNNVVVRNCYVHDSSGSGIRFNDSDHMLIEDCTVARTCWWTWSAESAIVFAESVAAAGDNTTDIKMIFRRNVAYDNWNRIPFFSLTPVGSPPGGYPDYGTASQNYVLDGHGLYVTRSDPAYAGTFLIENNICVNNGKNGITFDGSAAAKGIIRHNTLYYNGAFDFIQTEHDGPNRVAGITSRTSGFVTMANNIVTCRPGQAEITEITCRADSGGDLNDTYFDLDGGNGLHRFWYNVAGAGSAPSDPGGGVHAIPITAGATDIAVAAITRLVINNRGDFSAPVPAGATVTVTDNNLAHRDDVADTGSTGHAFVVTQQGSGLNAYQALTIWDGTPRSVDYNMIQDGAYGGTLTAGTNDSFDDPEFINPSTDLSVADFQLQSTSPAIGGASGTGDFASSEDFAGTARPICSGPDQGAYEALNNPPFWTNDPFNRPDATEGVLYSKFINFNGNEPDGDPETYAIVSGPSWLSMVNTSLGKIEGTPAPTDVGPNVFVVSISDGCNPPVEATMNITVTTDYDVWAANFPGFDLTDPGADFNGNGLSNNEDRIWGIDPLGGSSPRPITVPLDPAAGTFGYTRRDTALSGITYTVWTSTDLQTWMEDTGAVQAPGTPVVEVETVSVTLSPGLLTATRLYVQVRAAE